VIKKPCVRGGHSLHWVAVPEKKKKKKKVMMMMIINYRWLELYKNAEICVSFIIFQTIGLFVYFIF
jgi:hypothetical protein